MYARIAFLVLFALCCVQGGRKNKGKHRAKAYRRFPKPERWMLYSSEYDPVVEENGCFDLYGPRCVLYANNPGYCHYNEEFMKKFCKKSCKWCKDMGDRDPIMGRIQSLTNGGGLKNEKLIQGFLNGDCEDLLDDCSKYIKTPDDCNNHSSLTRKYCARTCGHCCSDRIAECSVFIKRESQCTSLNGFFRKYCPSTCKFCGPPKKPVKTKDCADTMSDCRDFDAEDCRSHEHFCRRFCPKSCGYCEPIGNTTAKPKILKTAEVNTKDNNPLIISTESVTLPPDADGNKAVTTVHTEVLTTLTEGVTTPTKDVRTTTGDVTKLTEGVTTPTEHATTTQNKEVRATTGDIAKLTEGASTQTEHATTPTEHATTLTEDATTPTQGVITTSEDATTPTEGVRKTTGDVNKLTEDATTSTVEDITTHTEGLTTLSKDKNTPTQGVTTTSEDATTPTEHATTPTEHATTPTEHATTPTEHATTPTEGATTPTEHATTPTEHATTPTEHATTPTEHATTPTEHATTPTVTTMTTKDEEGIATESFTLPSTQSVTTQNLIEQTSPGTSSVAKPGTESATSPSTEDLTTSLTYDRTTTSTYGRTATQDVTTFTTTEPLPHTKTVTTAVTKPTSRTEDNGYTVTAETATQPVTTVNNKGSNVITHASENGKTISPVTETVAHDSESGKTEHANRLTSTDNKWGISTEELVGLVTDVIIPVESTTSPNKPRTTSFQTSTSENTGKTKCQTMQIKAESPLVGAFYPECKENGEFQEKQCWGSTGYCWCVDQEGNEIPGTKVQFKQPNCALAETSTTAQPSTTESIAPSTKVTKQKRQKDVPASPPTKKSKRKTKTTPKTACKDRLNNCAKLIAKNKDYCENYVNYMKEYCRKTCNFCSPTVAIPKCRDKRKRKCKRYAKFQGYCTVYKDYMSEMCPRSCRFCGVAVVNKKIAYKVYNEKYEFAIKTMWDGSPINHDPIKIKLSAEDNLNVRLEVSGPFFDQPGKPPCLAGQPCWRLWEYEVAEVFFLGDKQKYLELEVSPHGPHLLLLLDGVRKPFKTKLPMRYSATIDNIKKTWNGTAIVPIDYFPPNMRKINAYAIHGPDNSKVYQALYPAKGTLHPDFHQLKFFQDFDFKSMFPQAWTAQPMSPFWVDRI